MCAWAWADSFDPYAATTDATAGYWDSGTLTNMTLTAGRFAGSQAIILGSATLNQVYLAKSSATNDAIHHLTVAFRQTGALSGTNIGGSFQFLDGTTGQCAICFRSDGTILLTSGSPVGATLATYAGAVSAQNTWTAFEFEVIISNTVGRFRARKNGSTSDDFDSGATLNTRPGANSYANKLQITQNVGVTTQQLDDLIWRSDAASVPWIGDVRIIARAPATDVSVQFSRSQSSIQQVISTTTSGYTGPIANQIWAVPIIPTYPGQLSALLASFGVAITGRVNMALYDNSGPVGSGITAAGSPGALLAQATQLTNPGIGLQSFTLATPYTITQGTRYWLAMFSDANISSAIAGAALQTSTQINATYGAFPASISGSGLTGNHTGFSYLGIQYNPTNSSMVSEAQQDAATSYVYDSTPGHADFYGLAPLSITPQAVFGVTTRMFVQKSDAGARSGAVQLKSGGTTVQSTPAALSSSWGWMWRVDQLDPATGSAWTPAGVNNAQMGPICTA